MSRRNHLWEILGRCDVCWGSHACMHEGDHEGDCECSCCTCVDHPDPDSGCVAKPPYYGPDTRFYGADVRLRGLPHVDDVPR